jgi:hypothetical protein
LRHVVLPAARGSGHTAVGNGPGGTMKLLAVKLVAMVDGHP